MKKDLFGMGYLSLCFLISGVLLLSSFQKNTHCMEEGETLTSQYSFAFTLQPTANSGLVTYWEIGVYNDKIISKKAITEINFILAMKGEQYSRANPEGINLFETINSEQCFYQYPWDTACNPTKQYYRLDDLWTLRYSKNPQCQCPYGDSLCMLGCNTSKDFLSEGMAANKTYPSDAQMKILESYGVNHYTDFFYGDNMYRMFNDINDATWQDAYKAAK